MFFTVYILFKEKKILEFFNSIKNDRVRQFILFVDDALKQVVYSMFFTAVITGGIATFLYTVFGMPFAVLLGVTTGIVALIPVLGCWLVYVPITFYILSQGDVSRALVFLGLSAALISTLPDMVIRPIIASKRINTGLLVLGFICGALVFGPVGILLGPLVIIAWVGFIRIFLMEEAPSRK